MKLDNITAYIRLREPWEAVDLGFAMVQQNARWIFPVWALLLGLFAVAAWLVMPAGHKVYAPLLLWWFKPLYDRVLLHILSQQMFNQRLSGAEVFSAIPGLLSKTGLFSALTWRRLSLSRAFNLPVWQLEQLRGKPRKERQNLLHRHTHSHAVWLMIACIHLEFVLIASLYALIMLFDPTGGAWDFLLGSWFDTFDDQAQYWGSLIYLVIYTLAVLVIEPLYVAGAFSLYLNRRTQLEAWDIELAFRNMGERLRKLAQAPLGVMLAVLLAAGFTGFSSAPAWAAGQEYLAAERLPPEAAQEQLEQVMQREELSNVRTIKRWMERNPDEPDETQDFTLFSEAVQVVIANIMKILLWTGLVVLVILAFVYRKALLALLKPLRQQPGEQQPPDILFGMDIRPESLPDDIAAASRRLWEQGQHREALSLLYRGALMRLTRQDAIPIRDSHTEGDILRLAQTRLADSRQEWLTALTRTWQETAYAHRIPADDRVRALLAGWQVFAIGSEGNP